MYFFKTDTSFKYKKRIGCCSESTKKYIKFEYNSRRIDLRVKNIKNNYLNVSMVEEEDSCYLIIYKSIKLDEYYLHVYIF